MKMSRIMMFNAVAFLVMLLSFSLFFMGSYSLSTGSSYHLAGGSGIFTSIVSLLGGSLLGLADVFLIFFVYLPIQKEGRLGTLRDTLSKVRNKASERQEQFNDGLQVDEEGWMDTVEKELPMRSSKPRMKMIGTRVTFLIGFLALLFGVAIFFVEISVPHVNASVRGFVSFTGAGAFFLITGILLFIMHTLFRKM